MLHLREGSIYINYLELSTDLSVLHFFVKSFISVTVKLMDIYFTLWVITQCYVTYFVVRIVPAMAIGSSFSWLLWHAPSFVCVLCKHFLSCTTTCSRLILYIPFPCPRISNCSKDPWFPLFENGIRKQDLGSGCVFTSGMSLLLGHLSWESKT